MRRVKQSLFDILDKKVINSEFLDMFAGIGSVGIEAISRGAKKVVFIEKDAACTRVIKSNLRICRFEDTAEVIQADVFTYFNRRTGRNYIDKYDIIFIGPPFRLNLVEKSMEMIDSCGLLNNRGWIIYQHHVEEKVPERAGQKGVNLFRSERYGKTMLSFYRYD